MKFHLKLILIILFSSTFVNAYLDPGTGSMIFQVLIAGLAGVLFLVKSYWSSIKQKITIFLSSRHNEEKKN